MYQVNKLGPNEFEVVAKRSLGAPKTIKVVPAASAENVRKALKALKEDTV